jgi:hypothetical protein
MEETEKLFEPTPVDRDATLVTPRFDEVEAQVARPVVPLAGGRPVARTARRRQWPIALVLISALAGGVVSILAFRMYQQRQQQVVAQSDSETAQADNAAQQQSSEPTPQAQAADDAASEEQAQTNAPVVFEEFDPAKEGVATSVGGNATRTAKAADADAKTSTAAGKEERKENAKPAPRAAESRPRLVETIPASRPVEARGENVSRDERRDDDFFEERRERRRQRREAWRRDERREERRGPRRNIDRIKDIFEGPPPA